jgi:hypothetical protein
MNAFTTPISQPENDSNSNVGIVVSDENEEQASKFSVNTIPQLIIGCGGFGAQVAGLIKSHNLESQSGKFTRFIVIDTDASTKDGFEASEFIRPDPKSLMPVFRNPDKHPETTMRYGWNESAIASPVSELTEKQGKQAGAIRMIGSACTTISAGLIRQRITTAVSELRRQWAALNEALQETGSKRVNFNVQNEVNIAIVASSFGGTGSSMINEVAAICRNKFAGGIRFSIQLYTITHDVLEFELMGQEDEYERCKANQAATFREIEAFESGWMHQHRVKIGGENPFVSPAYLYDQIFVHQRTDNGGNDYGSIDVVADSIARHIATDSGTKAGDALRRADANDQTQQGLVRDPETGRKRNISNAVSVAVGFGHRRLKAFCTSQTMVAILQNRSIGKKMDSTDAETRVKSFLSQSGNSNLIRVNERLRSASTPSLKAMTRPLYSKLTRSAARLQLLFENHRR